MLKMHVPNTTQILRLYKDILRYGQQLKYTDKNYFYNRVQIEFKKNKDLNDTEITFNYKVSKENLFFFYNLRK